jgi:hypothetical protein
VSLQQRPEGPVAVQLDVFSQKPGDWLDAVGLRLHFKILLSVLKTMFKKQKYR